MTFAARPHVVAGTGAVVNITNQTASDTETAGLGATLALAGYNLTSTGTVQTIELFTVNDVEDWVTPTSAAGAAYQVRATVSSGDTPNSGSALNTWLTLGSDQVWYQSNNVPGTVRNGTLLIEIRDTATSTVQDSATVTLTATYNP